MTGEMWRFVGVAVVFAAIVVVCYWFVYVPRRTPENLMGEREEDQLEEEEIPLPEGYSLEEGEPDFLILHRPDGSVVGIFAFPDATPQTIRQAAERDVREHGG